jgi:diguanylate cyclase (GGDEF)-like protein
MPGQIYFSLLNPAIALTFGALFILLWRRWPFHRHLLLLANAFALSAVGFIFYDLSPLSDGNTNKLISNASFAVSIMVACCAAIRRIHLQVPVRIFGVIMLIVAAFYLWFLYVDPSINARIVVMGLALGGITLATVLQLSAAKPISAADRLLIIAGWIGVALSLIRPVLALLGILDPADAGSFQQSTYWISVQAFSPILIGAIALLFLSALSIDTFEQLRSEANHDYLTGLLNRRGFETAVTAALALADRQRPALMMADIDNFKLINDSFGHKVGDQVIAGVARAISSHGSARLTARVGGEEFALYYEDDDSASLQHHADSIRHAVRRMSVAGLPADHALTLSIGIHEHRDSETLGEMLIESDRALYKAKTSGKDRAVNSATPFRRRASTAKLA